MYLTVPHSHMYRFSKYGEVASVHIPIDKITGRSKCFAFILFSFPADASEALSDLDGSSYQGRLLHILPAKEPIEKKQQPGPVAACKYPRSSRLTSS